MEIDATQIWRHLLFTANHDLLRSSTQTSARSSLHGPSTVFPEYPDVDLFLASWQGILCFQTHESPEHILMMESLLSRLLFSV